MVISIFTSLVITLKLSEHVYLARFSSEFLFSLSVCKHNWPLWIVPRQFLNSSLYWSYGKIQYLPSLYQVEKLILAYISVPDQLNTYPSSPLYNLPHKGAFIYYPDPYPFYYNFTTTMVFVNISPTGSWFIIVATSRSKPLIHVDSYVYSSEIKLQVGWLPLGYNHSSGYWSICPWYRNSPSIRVDIFNYPPNDS